MSYQAIIEMSQSGTLMGRIAAAAAAEGLAERNGEHPVQWAQQNIWRIASTDGWAEAWNTAEENKTINDNPDTGARNNVITDDMIREAVVDALPPGNSPTEPPGPGR
jgi:hypothetical protein